jgi:hypothetical protein
VGVTSTPTVDPATGVAYLMAKSYVTGTAGPVGYFLHAVDPSSGAERPGFPVQIQGAAQNNASQVFRANNHVQRPGLLLLGGVVYAAFSGLCDTRPYQGWISGVSTSGRLTALWTPLGHGAGFGGGIWQSGAGLVSDGPGQILVGTGNGEAAPSGSIPGHTPPANLPESVVRLAVQTNGTLKPTDFFTPKDAAVRDQEDLDFASGAPVALPPQFGTPAYPHLMVTVSKDGYLYLFNRDNLGGVGQGRGGDDGELGRIGPAPGMWSSPAVWPGDGGYVYAPTAADPFDPGGGRLVAYRYGTNGHGVPRLTQAGVSAESFGFGSGRPVVTSTGALPGTSLVWIIHSDDRTGVRSALEAYDPVPVKGVLRLVGKWPIGTGSKFSQPGVSGGIVYVPTRDGQVIGFGSV